MTNVGENDFGRDRSNDRSSRDAMTRRRPARARMRTLLTFSARYRDDKVRTPRAIRAAGAAHGRVAADVERNGPRVPQRVHACRNDGQWIQRLESYASETCGRIRSVGRGRTYPRARGDRWADRDRDQR